MSQFARAFPDDFERRQAELVEDHRQARVDAIVARWLAAQSEEDGEDG